MTTLEEAKKRLADPYWRLNNLYAVQDESGDLVKFRLNYAQRALLARGLHTLNWILKSRQHGFSTLIAILFLDRLLFESDKTAGIIDRTMPDAKRKLAKIKLAYENLDNKKIHPDTWQIGGQLKERVPLTTDSKEALEWANGCSALCGTSFRGGSLQYLHVSEFPFISMERPDKAREIWEGAMNAITGLHLGFFEGTHEGGQYGLAYEQTQAAMSAEARHKRGEPISRKEFRFHFFGTFDDPKNREDRVKYRPTAELDKYFRELEQKHGIRPDEQQKAWYQIEKGKLKWGMWKEHPVVPQEAFKAKVEGSIYGETVLMLRAQGRVTDFAHEIGSPFFTSWDIGQSDHAVIWLLQVHGRDFLALDCFRDNHRPIAEYATVCQTWEEEFRMKIHQHLLPHDANTTDKGSGLTPVQFLEKAGLRNMTIVPRIPDIWSGIGKVRDVLPRFYLHESRLSMKPILDGEEAPTAIGCLEGYRSRVSKVGESVQEKPLHDLTSHVCDGLRTFAEGYALGLVTSANNKPGPRQVVTGFRDPMMRGPRVKRY